MSRAKTNFKFFQGLEIRLLKFKGFQDAYEPCLQSKQTDIPQTDYQAKQQVTLLAPPLKFPYQRLSYNPQCIWFSPQNFA